jgi:integrase/recombinase XerD
VKATPQSHFANLVEQFFLDRLIRQRNSSPQTVAAYRDCFRLLFEFAREHRNKPADRMTLADLDAPFVWRSWIIWKGLARTPFAAGTLV